MKKIAAKYSIPMVGIALGDILGKGDAQTFTSMKRVFGETGVPFFTTIGNHDKSSVDYTGDTYRDVLGPRWYSFNRGDVHFIAMDNIIFTGTDYTGGFTDEQVAWLEKDLSFVPTDKMVILYYHIPLRDNTGYLNRKKVLDMISRYKNPTLMCAHTHYFQPYHMRSHKLFERIHGGTCGYFWRSTCGGDGTPNGFMVYEIDGTEIIDTYFKASQRADDYQIRRRRQDVERYDGDVAELRRPLDPRLPHRGRETSGGKRHQPLLPPIPVQAEKSRSDRHRGSCDRQFQPCLHTDALQRKQRFHRGRGLLTLPAVYIERAALFAGRPVSVRHTMKPRGNHG